MGIMTPADRERRCLDEIEQNLIRDNPRLVRLLSRPGRWSRLRWGPRRHVWMAYAVGVGLTLVASVLALLVAR
jgi:hypothetical protein